MKFYNVVWEEKHLVTIEAENEEEAINKVWKGEYKEEEESGERTSDMDAYEIIIK